MLAHAINITYNMHIHVYNTRGVLAVNQDPMGIQGKHVRSFGGDEGEPAMSGKYHIFSKPMVGESVAVAILSTNSFGYPGNVSFTLAEVSSWTLRKAYNIYTYIYIYSLCC